jgi:hypothetical protein
MVFSFRHRHFSNPHSTSLFCVSGRFSKGGELSGRRVYEEDVRVRVVIIHNIDAGI